MMFEYIIFISALMVLIRVIIGPSFADRTIASDLLINLLILYMILYSINTRSVIYLDIAILLSILSFTGTLSIARWVRKK